MSKEPSSANIRQVNEMSSIELVRYTGMIADDLNDLGAFVGMRFLFETFFVA
jgi:hypothetical protein